MEIVKRFVEWVTLKEKLHKNTHKPPLFREGELWWCSIGENVGSEINGKSQRFSRPVLIYRKLSSAIFMAIPTTSQNRKGSWYVEINLGKIRSTVILSQARVADYKRLSSKIGHLDEFQMRNLKKKFIELYK